MDWIRIITQITKDFDKINHIKCPNCEKYGLDYIYIGDGKTRIGFLQIWCNECLKGIYVSRAVAPQNAKFATFESDVKNIVPKIEFVEI